MKFYSRFGKKCRYKFGDIVVIKNQEPQRKYYIINATWIGNSNGFWEIEFQDIVTYQKQTRLRPKGLKKVAEINESNNK